MAFKRSIAAAVLALCAAVPLTASADEWRWCAASDVVNDDPSAPLFLMTEPFRTEDMPDYEAQYEADARSELEPIRGELTISCSPAFPDQNAANDHAGDWVISLEGAGRVRTASWPSLSQRMPRRAEERAATPSSNASVTSAGEARSTAQVSPRSTGSVAANAKDQRATGAESARAEGVRQASEARLFAGANASGASSRPLRFSYFVGMTPQAGDRRNPQCASNIVERPGPKGWEVFIHRPAGADAEADKVVEALKPQFIAKCEAASGRRVAGTVRSEWNTGEGDDERLQRQAAEPSEWTVQID